VFPQPPIFYGDFPAPAHIRAYPAAAWPGGFIVPRQYRYMCWCGNYDVLLTLLLYNTFLCFYPSEYQSTFSTTQWRTVGKFRLWYGVFNSASWPQCYTPTWGAQNWVNWEISDNLS
jgi:hypothetical protein